MGMTRDKARPIGLGKGVYGTAAAVALALAQSPATAQTNEDSVDDQVVEEIVVTGSRLLRRDFSAPSPISTINRETLAFSGQPTLETTLNKMPQIAPDFDRTANNPGNGTARVNLRYTAIGGAEETIGWVPDQTRCDDARGGWYFDDPGAPSRLIACARSCAELTENGGEVKVVVGCPRVEIPLE